MGVYGHTLYLMVVLPTQLHSLVMLLSLCVQYIMFYNQHCVRVIQACPMLSGHDRSLSLVDGACTGVSGEEGRQSGFRQFVDRNESDPEVWYKEYI